MKESMLDGKRLIELPAKTVSLVRLEFTQEERDIYDMVCTDLAQLVPCAFMCFLLTG